MKRLKLAFVLASLLIVTCFAQAQNPTYQYGTTASEAGSTFFAMDGSTGQLRFMNDTGTQRGQWIVYGNMIRTAGNNNLRFAIASFKNGRVFYALEGNTGQLHYMTDFGDKSAVWRSYGLPIRVSGANNLGFSAEAQDNGTKFTAMDCSTGKVFYMFDYGEDDGMWKAYGELIK